MKKCAFASIALLLAACGDEVTQINQTGMEVADSVENLSECTAKNEGDQAMVKGERTIRVCMDGEWILTSSDADFSCTTKELADKSGLKIVCNGDSIGVVLNGAKGDKGEDGQNGTKGDSGDGCSLKDRTDTTVTVVCGDSTMVIELGHATDDTATISLDTLIGYTQKGPFLKGSSVYLYELNGSLNQTNGNFTSVIASDDGRYRFRTRGLKYPYAMVVVDGYYRNEVTGKTSDAPIRLRAITDVSSRVTGSANVNLLTHLEFDRVNTLATGPGKLKLKEAKHRAQAEILDAFHIDTNLVKNVQSEDMDVFGKTDADAALLAISVLLQGDGKAADLSVLMIELADDLVDGKWDGINSAVHKAALADWALKADTENRLAQFRKNVADWHLGDIVPGFEKFVRKYVSDVIGPGVCGSEKYPVNTFAHVSNKNSKYYAQAYDSIDTTKSSLARVVCDDKGGKHWRIATNLERDTKGWEAAEDGTVKMGQIDTSIVYVYDGGWRQGTELDRVVGFGCIKAFKDSVAEVSDSSWYACIVSKDEGHAWHLMSNLEKDSVSLKAYNDKDSIPGLLLDAPFTKKTMVWDADTLREASKYEQELKRGCVTRMYGTTDSLSNTLTYSCDESGWSKTGTFSGNGLTYKAVQIGDQVWMAENLKTKSEDWGYYTEDDVFKYVDSSFCYNNDESYCAKYGRLYRWAAAVGKSKDECGREHECSLPSGNIRGICPEGWHLPSKAEWESLFAAVGGDSLVGTMLKSKSGWDNNGNGLDAFAFSVLPVGDRLLSGESRNEGIDAHFWTSTEDSKGWAYAVTFALPYVIIGINIKDYAFSVRCVKD